MPRSTVAPPSYYVDDRYNLFYFLKMEWPDPVGLLRWTDYPDDIYNQNIEGGAFDWDGNHVFEIGQFEQGSQDALSVTDVSFGNADNSFSDLMKNFDFGCRGVSIECWVGRFQKDVDADVPENLVFIAAELAFSGTMDRAEVGDDVRVSIIPYRHPLTAKFPRRRFSSSFGCPWIPPANFKISNWGAQGTVTLPSRQNPNSPGSNPGPGGGLTIPPIPPWTGPHARGPVNRVPGTRRPPPPPGRPPTTDSGPTQPDPRTVDR